MKSGYNFLGAELNNYRRSFLKRKNVNGWKKNINGTPLIIDKLFNSFDRKIKGIPLFANEVKIEYFKRLNDIFQNYYDDLKYNNLSRKDCYYKYCAENFKTTGKGRGKKNNLNELMTFKQFVKSGLCNNYR